MKLKKYLYTAACATLLLTSMPACTDYLDVSDELASNLTIEQVFDNVNYTKQWHANIFNCISEYSAMTVTLNGFQNPWAAISGEIVSSWGDCRYEMVNGFNASNAGFHRFVPLYQYIRQAHLFLQNAKEVGKTGDREILTKKDIERMKAEAKFFIAYSYFSLFELYGPVPIVEATADPSSSDLDYERASVDELVNYIDGLLTEALDGNALPATIRQIDEDNSVTYDFNEMVRPTKETVLALQAKLWVYAASKLFNGGYTEALSLTNKDGKRLFPDYDANKWNIAKQKLETFLKFAKDNGHELYKYYTDGELNPDESVYRVLQDYNDEIIWATGKNSFSTVDDGMDRRATPRDLPGPGWASYGCTQEAVDAFFMNNGLEINDPNSGYKHDGFVAVVNPANKNEREDPHVFNMYANREARFYNAVTYQGRSWHIQPSANADYTVDFSVGGGCDNSGADNPRIGYLLYKRTNRSMINEGNGLKKYGRPSVIFRLADFYLYYAEACNEVNPNDPNIIKYLDMVRERAGIPGYQELNDSGKKTGVIGNKEKQARAIRLERQVELYTEGQRYFDIRRWMICGAGEEADQTVVHGMNMAGKNDIVTRAGQETTPLGKSDSFYQTIVFEQRQWTKAMYLYPIPHDEIQKSEKLVQNPLW